MNFKFFFHRQFSFFLNIAFISIFYESDLQIRIKVDEGRHIFGRNINPVVRVTVGGVKKQTRVKYTTNQPYYNQVMIIRWLD